MKLWDASNSDDYPKKFINFFGKEVVILNELCSCGRMITEHGGANGHGASYDGECPIFTWVKWIHPEGDEEE